MANPNFKGRPVGSGKSTFIEDPLLGDYKIVIDEYSYNVFDITKNKTIGFYRFGKYLLDVGLWFLLTVSMC